ncbi:hypothetical protein CR51_39150 [Caballeronia megalochromosomata]|nr:hypothetical protein CR51_39150 [Caballeronia megalochromosomata]
MHADEGSANEQESAQAQPPTKTPSPWLVLPTFSNNPKLGTSVGGLVGYARKFDPESQVSMFGVAAQYTSTNSVTAAIFARTSFDQDQHRLSVLAVGGSIKNDYDNFLGTGTPLRSEDHIRAFVARYLYRFTGDWFIGAQTIFTNYQIVGQTALDDDLLSVLGLTGFKAGGVGLVLNHDSRDIVDAPKQGWYLNLNNIAYRQALEGSNNFSVYRADYRQFWSHGDGNVFAVRQSNQWTADAPAGAYAPVVLRGYTMGEYLGKYMSSLEVEERHRLAERWTATLFAGVACLYGASRGGCTDSANRFPSVGAGVQYILKPAQGIVANMEFAAGKEGNKALLFKMGYGW